MEMENGSAPRNWEAFCCNPQRFFVFFHGTTDICINYHLVSQNKKPGWAEIYLRLAEGAVFAGKIAGGRVIKGKCIK